MVTATKFRQWQRTRAGWLAGATVELALAYGFGSLAIDRGHLLLYGLTLFSVGTAVVSIVNAVKANGKN